MKDSTVMDEVMRLPCKYKDVILLRYYQEMKLSKIGETLGIPLETARSRLKHANKILHQRLERWYFDE
jgi:RNA polymerase sigma-70 factor (ECF subfamily)